MDKIKRKFIKKFHPNHIAIRELHRLLCMRKKKYKLISFFLWRRLILKYGIHIGSEVQIEDGIKLPHPSNIVIGQGVKLGKRCTIYQNVTLGSKIGIGNNNKDYPTIGDDVVIYPNTTILGSIIIGDNTIIGANSLVINDLEANSVYAGNPLKKIK